MKLKSQNLVQICHFERSANKAKNLFWLFEILRFDGNDKRFAESKN
ncbi:hypothetical protein ACWIUD_04285 [Helicobacter sp. 23-1044]